MTDINALAPNYRRAVERWPDAQTLCACHRALLDSYRSGAHGLVEQVKSFIESVCLTILGELGHSVPSSTPQTTELLVAALSSLGFENSRGASKLDSVLSGFNRLSDALAAMRNENGPVAHGKDAFLDCVTADHARAFLYTGDAILGVLLSALEGKEPDLNVTREPYERFAHLNSRIDQAISLDARVDDDGMLVVAIATSPSDEDMELRIEPSRLLYGVDRSAYVEIVKTALDARKEGRAVTPERKAGAELARIAGAGQTRWGTPEPMDALARTDAGPLVALRTPLASFLTAAGLDPHHSNPALNATLVDSLLASARDSTGLDWRRRDALRSRLKVSLRRVLVRFDTPATQADDLANRLVSWLSVRAPE